MAFVDLSFQVFLLRPQFSGFVFQAFSFCRKALFSQYHFHFFTIVHHCSLSITFTVKVVHFSHISPLFS